MMEMLATITGYLIIISVCVFVTSMGVYWTVHRIIDALGVRDEFLKMKRDRNEAWATIREINEGGKWNLAPGVYVSGRAKDTSADPVQEGK